MVSHIHSNCPGIDSKAPTHQPTAQHLRFTFHAISLSRVSLVHHHPRENKIYCVWGFIRCGFLFCCSSNYFLLRRRRFFLLLLLDMSQLWICEWVSESLIDYIGVRNLIGIGTWAGRGIDTQQQPKHVPINNYISAVIESVIHIIRCHEEDRRMYVKELCRLLGIIHSKYNTGYHHWHDILGRGGRRRRIRRLPLAVAKEEVRRTRVPRWFPFTQHRDPLRAGQIIK